MERVLYMAHPLTFRNQPILGKKRGTYRFIHRLHGLRANKVLCPLLCHGRIAKLGERVDPDDAAAFGF